MALYTLSPLPKFTAWNNSGLFVPSGKLYTYLAGSTTPVTTYKTDSGTAHANPIIMDGAARPPTGGLYLEPGKNYKFELQDASGNVIWTQDGIAAVPLSASNQDVTGTAGEALTGGDVVYLSDGSGALQDGQWYKADADFTYSSTLPPIGMVVTSIASGATGTVRLAGQLTVAGPLTPGDDYYVSATAGALTVTAPANRRFVGRAESTTSIVLLPNPTRVSGTAGGVVYGTGAGVAASAAGTSGQVLLSGGAGAPTWGSGSPMSLLKSNSGTDASAGATNVDTIAISGLTAKDRLLVYTVLESVTQQTTRPILASATDANIELNTLSNGASHAAGRTWGGSTLLQQVQSSATAYMAAGSIGSDAGVNGFSSAQTAVTTAWTAAWTLALRHGGVTAGGTFKWSWSVYKIAGQ